MKSLVAIIAWISTSVSVIYAMKLGESPIVLWAFTFPYLATIVSN